MAYKSLLVLDSFFSNADLDCARELYSLAVIIPLPPLQEFMDLVDKIFQSEPTKRIDIEGILRHPWTVKVRTNL